MNRSLIIGLSIVFGILNIKNASARDTYLAPKAVSKSNRQIFVSVDPKIELISIIQTIGNYNSILGFLLSEDSTGYKNDVVSHFKAYNNHPAVKMFDRISSKPRKLNFSAPSNLMLCTDNRLYLRNDIILDTFLISRAYGEDSIKVFMEYLRDFAERSSFNTFFRNHKSYYMKIIENTISKLGNLDYVAELENFYGTHQESYNIVLVSLYNHVGFGNSLLLLNERRELFCTLGPQKAENNIPFFGDENYLKYLIRHEFSHPFINPLTEKHWDYIKTESARYDSIPEKTRKQVCGDWQECINESVIRAITTHLASNESDELGKRAYEKEKSKGIPYLDELLVCINYYQSGRTAYPTIDSYFIKILDVFKK